MPSPNSSNASPSRGTAPVPRADGRLPHRLLVLGLLLLIAGATPPTTAPATLPALTAQDRALLHQLETGTWRERQAAQRELADLGPAQAPMISAMLASTVDPEAEARLEAVLKQMNDDRKTGLSRVMLHFKNTPAKTVYESLFSQAWAPLKCNPTHLLDSVGPVSIDADREPFWTVFQRLGKMTHIGFDRATGVFVLSRGDTILAGPQYLSGGFLVVLTGARPFVLNKPAGVEKRFWLDLAIYPEPKLDVQQIDPRVDVAHAIDDHGNSISQQAIAPFVETDSLVDNSLSLSMLTPAKNPGTRLVRFQATLHATIILKSALFDIANPAAAPRESVDINGLKLLFTGCKKVNGRFYQFSFQTGPDPTNQFQKIMGAASSMLVLDPDGNAMPNFGSSTSQDPTVGNSLNYTFAAQAGDVAPKRLIWQIPLSLKALDIPVNFKDVQVDLSPPAAPAPENNPPLVPAVRF